MNKKFSGYKMVVCCFLITMAVLGMGYLTLSIYLPVLLEEFQISAAVMSGIFAVMSAGSMIGSTISGGISGKIGVKKMVLLGVASLLGGYGILYFSTNVFMMYIAAACIGLSLSWAGVICIGRIVPNWFVEKQGTFLGIVMAASGVGAMIASPIITKLITSVGWRVSMLVTLGAMAVLTVPTALMLVEKPEDIGQTALGSDSAAMAGSDTVIGGPSFAVARKSSAFMIMFVLWIAIAFANGGFNSQVSNAFAVKGFDLVFIGTIVSVSSFANTAGNLILGVINDKLGTKASLVWIMGCGALSMVVMLIADTNALALVFALLFGLSLPMGGNLITLLVGRTYGMKAFPQMLGIINGAVALIGVFTPIVIGMMFDMTGNYNIVCMLIAGLLVAGCICGLIGINIGTRLQEESHG